MEQISNIELLSNITGEKNLEPSDADINVTNRLCKTDDILDIKATEHIIISDGSYISFEEKP